MTIGLDQVIACPHCKGLAWHMTLNSGNTFHAQHWTDGKAKYLMLPQLPSIVKCRHCESFYWLEDAEEVGMFARHREEEQNEHPEWSKASEIEELTVEEYYQAIAQPMAIDQTQERNLRVLAWWRENDRVRYPKFWASLWKRLFRRKQPSEASEQTPVMSKECRENLEKLVTLLDENVESDLLMKCEVWRELGDFEQAQSLLQQVPAEKYHKAMQLMQKLIDAKETQVQLINFEK